LDILFLSVSTGGGHIKAAEALKEYVEKNYSGSRCKIVDTFKYISPLIDKFLVGGYLNIINKLPFLYGSLYKLSEHNKGIIDATYAISQLFSYKLIPLIREFNPTIIVCTHTLPLQMTSYLKQKKIISVPITAIVTDYVNHPFWKLDNIDALIVPHDKIMFDMVQAGIPESIIYPYGIPLSEEFLIRHNRKNIMANLGLEDKLTGLIMGGSLGIRSVYNSFKMLLRCEREMQIIVVTGKNAHLRNKMEDQLRHYNITNTKINTNNCTGANTNTTINANAYTGTNTHTYTIDNTDTSTYTYIYNNKNIKILGYTDIIPELMDISDFIITKPGGMTISEALVKELPIFLTFPIPGQEERNCHFLIENGVAVNIQPKDNIDHILTDILDNTSKMKNMKKTAKSLARPNSCHDTSMLLDKLQQCR
jgi:processive 1,2-diacylglycerol beta-glucosyltransferase